MASKVKIFVSYSHKDTEYIGPEGLLGFLKGLERDGDVELWVDEKLSGGDEWDDVLKSGIRDCDIGLVFVSQAFLDSHYCMDVEISGFLDRCRSEGMKIFPILLSPCEWELHPWLSHYQALPSGGETIEEHYTEKGRKKRLYLKIRKELRALIEKVREERLAKKSNPTETAEVNAERRNVTLLQMSLTVDKLKYDMDDEDVLEFLHEAAPLVKERYISEVELLEGFVVNMSGTGHLSVCFGYPNASELDSVKAIRAALSISQAVEELNDKLEQEWDARLTVKAGAHTGLMIGRTGADAQQELEHGPTSVIATTLMRASPGDLTYISESTHKLVRGFFDMEVVPEAIHNDSGELIKGWSVKEDRGLVSRFEANVFSGLTPIIGRDEEIKLIMERWQHAEVGQGQFVTVSAEAGVGKSRLLQEIKTLISKRDSQIFSCQFSPFHKNSSLFGLIRAFEPWLSITEHDSDEEKLGMIEETIKGLDWGNDEIIALIAGAFLIQDSRYPMPDISPQQIKQRTFEALFSLLVEASADTPLLIVLEDLHWMDPSTMEWLELAFNEIPATNILIFCTTRPEFHLPVDWNVASYYFPVRLNRLSKPQIAEMILELTAGRALPLELFNAICKKTEGYPLFIEDLTAMVMESGMVEDRDGILVMTRPLESLTIPGTLQESLMARLNNLDGGRLIAQIGAVIGREFSLKLISAIAPLENDKLKAVLDKLVGAGIVYKRGLISRVMYIFKHALIQDALYESLLKRKRKQYHLKIADAIEAEFPNIANSQPELLAIHYSKSGNYEKAVDYGIAACEKSARESANLETSNLVLSTLKDLERLPETPERNKKEKQIHLLHGPALLAVKGWSSPEIGNAYTKAKELSKTEDNLSELVKITRGLWGYYMVSAQLKASLDIGAELLGLGEEHQDEDITIEAHTTLCDSYVWAGNPEMALSHAEEGLSLYNLEKHHMEHSLAYGEDPSVIMLCYGSVTSFLLGDLEKSEDIVKHSKEQLNNYSHLFSKGFLMNGLAWHYMHRLMPEETLLWGEKLKKLSLEEEFPPWLALAKTHVGWATAILHDLEAGVKELLEGMNEWNSAGLVVTTGLGYAMVADAYLHANDYDNCLKYAQMGIDHMEGCEEKHYLSEVYRYKANAMAGSGSDHADVQACFERSIEVAKQQKAASLVERTERDLSVFLY